MGIKPSDFSQLKANVAKVDVFIGIDPGTHTGVAVWSPSAGRLIRVESSSAVQAEEYVISMRNACRIKGKRMHVIVEDTRNLKLPAHLVQQRSAMAMKNMGQVLRDMSRWEEFLRHHDIPFTMAGLSPKPFRTGDDAWFRQHTGWSKRSNEHGRAAAGLVFGR